MPGLRMMEAATAVSSSASNIEALQLRNLRDGLQSAEGFVAVVDALRRGWAATIDGAWKSSAALAVAALAVHAPKTLLVVLAHPADVDFWGEDLHSFAGQ